MWLICSTTQMPKEERVKWGEDCISCVTAKEMLMWAHPQSQSYSWGQKCEQEPASSTGSLSVTPLWQWQPPKFSGSGAASLGSRTAKRCWENPSNTALMISTCNKTNTTKGHRSGLLQGKFLLCHDAVTASPAQGLKGEVMALRKWTLRKWGREQN